MKYSQYHHLHHQWDKTWQDKIWHDMTRWLTLSKNNNKNTSGNNKVRIKSPYFHQKSYFIWQNNTKVLILQYTCPICVQYPTNTYVLLIINDLSQGERINTMTSLPSRLEFICHLCTQDVEDTPDVMMGSSSIVQSTSPITLISDDLSELTTHLIWPITTHDYHRWLITNNHHLWLMTMSYDHALWPMSYHYDLYLMTLIVTHHTWLWPITTHDSYLISPIHQ